MNLELYTKWLQYQNYFRNVKAIVYATAIERRMELCGWCVLSLLFSDSEDRIDIMKSMMSSGDNDVGENYSNLSDS